MHEGDGEVVELDFCATRPPITMQWDGGGDIGWVTDPGENVVVTNPVCTDFVPGFMEEAPVFECDCNDNGRIDDDQSPCPDGSACDRCGDVTGDGIVNFADILDILANWSTAGPNGDANCDDMVNFEDVLAVLANWD